ncbi:sensor histidine kinase [Amycolatopsis minnesotensis]|uniref:histidine kinase n=1 Tax=Amycolatopsis minnesotensis TaxID=337894 RepID=A0ABP5EDA9_9PSEU
MGWRTWWDALRYTVVATAGPQVPPRSAALRRIRGAVIVGVGLWAGFLAVLTTSAASQVKLPAIVLGVLAVAPAVLAVRWPLWAWRLLVVLLAVTPAWYQGFGRFWGWAWSPGLALTAALVFSVVGAAHAQPVLVWVALLSLTEFAFFVRDWRDLFLLAAVVTALLLLGNTRRQRRLAEHDRIEQQRGRLAEETRAAVLEERARIARELHDVVAHHMSVLALRADSARYRYPGLADEVRTEFAGLTETAREGMTELRRLLGVLRTEESSPTDPQPDAEKVVELVDRVRALGTPCTLDVHGSFDGLPAGVALSVYRIVQEALSNAVRHAPGAAIEVGLRIERDSIRAAVRNGPGEPPGPAEPGGKGHGLLGMRERVAMLDGTLVADATEEGGFRVEVTVPFEEKESAPS